MKEFKKYCHIENSYQAEYIQAVKERVNNPSLQWICQEKVHGAQSQFIIGREGDSIQVGFGKRSSELQADENFYNWQELLGRYQANAIKLFELLERDGYDVSNGINAYGEFFGGSFPGVIRKGVIRIQKGVAYTPDHEFYGFDIFIREKGYMEPEKAVEYYKEAGFFYAETLFKGTLDECLKYPCVFQSTIPGRLGLTPPENNEAEGVVIKPCVPQYFGNGERIVIKHKNPKFQEVVKGERKVKTEISRSEGYNSLASLVPDYINENRLVSVRSHLGETRLPQDFGKIMKEYTADVIQELILENKERSVIFESLDKSEQKAINSLISKLCAENIKAVYMS